MSRGISRLGSWDPVDTTAQEAPEEFIGVEELQFPEHRQAEALTHPEAPEEPAEFEALKFLGSLQTEALSVPQGLLQRTVSDLRGVLPEEGVGLWSGHDRDVRTWTFLPNVARDRRVRYAVHPQDWIDALRAVSLRGEVPIALVHSHPTAPAVPSSYDKSHWMYPDLWSVIVSFADENPQWNAYRFRK